MDVMALDAPPRASWIWSPRLAGPRQIKEFCMEMAA